MLSSQSLWDYQSVDLAWQPWADGTFLTADAQQLVLNGSVADIPFVIGELSVATHSIQYVEAKDR